MNATATAPAYTRRAAEGSPYALLNGAERYLHETRDDALLALLRRHGIERLDGLRILELGCGEGALLRSLLHYGAQGPLIEAVDIDPARVAQAKASLPDATLAVASVAALPYRSESFDLAFAFTIFSSVIDGRTRRDAASEAMRVLRPRGLLVVYDFQVNPINRRVRPLPARELRALFAPRTVEIERVTLAPPIVRVLGGRVSLCRPLERISALRTHLLAAVVKED